MKDLNTIPRTANEMYPSCAIHPGEMIMDEIEYRNISTEKLAKEIDMPLSVLSEVLKGNQSITTELALLLEAALGIEADIWLKQQAEYNKQQAKSDPNFLARLARIRSIASFL